MIVRSLVLVLALLAASGCEYLQMQPSNSSAPQQQVKPPIPKLP